ncbi:Putative GNAT domain, acyl-CoA N-acyltransferase [Septoria linicola]|uniref:GNAT domain, acyl-CoA N-acyltransferase n=1 Tax=Septoria linicola TaxID=215465 RepID=A0A9Q9B6J1_9PEZI|nr:Putative GNAT domain, acyl-CoA N-acyltransferase [Septoria linicola]
MPTTNRLETTAVSTQEVQFNDSTDIAGTMMSAFHEDPLWASLWSSHMSFEDIIKDCAARMPWNLVKAGIATPLIGYARCRLQALALADSTEVCWPSTLPPVASDDERRVYEQQFQAVTTVGGQIQGLDHQREVDLSRLIEDAEQRLIGDSTGLLELEYLAVHPAHQRTGIGRLLLLQGLAIADQLGVKTLVIAKNAGVKLYQAQGFCEVDKVVQCRPEYGWETPHVTTFLVREPRTRA